MTNIVDNQAVPALDALENAFRKPQYDSRVSDTKYTYYYPTSGIKNTSCLRYTIPAYRGPYVPEISTLIFAPDIKLTNKAKTDVPPLDTKAAPCNNFLPSLCAQLRIMYNSTTVCRIDNYPLYNYLRIMLSTDNTDIATWCETRCFKKDDGEFDDIDTTGWTDRRNLFGNLDENNKFEFDDKAHFFIGTLDHFLPSAAYLPSVDIHIQIDLSSPEYVFQCKDTANSDINYDFEQCKLFIRETKLNDKLFLRIEERLAKESIRQYFSSTEITTHSISKGDKIATFDNIASGRCPSRLMCFVQPQSVLNGDYTKNSFKFARTFGKGSNSFLLNNIRCLLKGEDVDALATNATTNLPTFRDHYFRLFLLTNMINNKPCSITFDDFRSHFCVFFFDLTATLGSSDYPVLPLVRKGALRLEVTFDEETTEPMSLITVMELQSAITLEHSGKVSLTAI